MAKYYVASCKFTADFPKISLAILDYIRTLPDIEPIRCCIPNYRVQQNTDRIADLAARTAWQEMPQSKFFQPNDEIISVCPNCINIVEEWRPGAKGISLWEIINADENFVFPDYHGLTVTIQDCWRTRERRSEQDAVRSLLKKMNIHYVEVEKNHANTDFCGSTLYREQPAKNAKLAPTHYIEQAQGKFLPHSKEEQIAIMKRYCQQYKTKTVVCYCHYCLEGLLQGGVDGRHIASLLFPAK